MKNGGRGDESGDDSYGTSSYDSESDDDIIGALRTKDIFNNLLTNEDDDLAADEEEAERLRKLLELMEDLRKYDVDKIRSNELSGLQLMLTGLQDNWEKLWRSLSDKLSFLNNLQQRHHSEQATYNNVKDYLEADSRNSLLNTRLKELDMKKERLLTKPIKDLDLLRNQLQSQSDTLDGDLKVQDIERSKLVNQLSDTDKPSA